MNMHPYPSQCTNSIPCRSGPLDESPNFEPIGGESRKDALTYRHTKEHSEQDHHNASIKTNN